MYRRTKVGLIIWGAIISGVGAIVLAAGGGIAGAIVLGFGCCFLIPGIILAITTSVHNNNVKTDNAGCSYVANCIYCGHPINVKVGSFQPHRNFPEGYVYCPVCKKPISKNAFTKVQDGF
ncbi:MAG: hypothetical protein IKI20_02295 [Lachnospiraceae bacterium]|nr:hypothetical protein [Lachnospiraceae bacterium]